MSASPIARQACISQSQAIPQIKRVVITDPADMPANYSSTLVTLAHSPLCKTPPKNIPYCLVRGAPRTPFRKCVPSPKADIKKKQEEDSYKIEDQEQFQLEL
uniref:Uncharacterized protein n=1 Tax=Megaselia scalaris TaxID=36166 RepID=T1H344_MEGSC